MGCCGRRATGPPPPGKVNQFAMESSIGEDGNMTQIQYIGNKIGMFSIFGEATKRNYRVSKHARIILVAPADAPGFLARRDFKLYESISTPVSAKQTVARTPQNLEAFEAARKAAETPIPARKPMSVPVENKRMVIAPRLDPSRAPAVKGSGIRR